MSAFSVTVEVISGISIGRRQRLPMGRSLIVGQSIRSGMVLAGDASLEGAHFSVECLPTGARLRDMKTPTGTRLNGQPVAEAMLREGDSIRAGQTSFVIHLEGTPPSPRPHVIVPDHRFADATAPDPDDHPTQTPPTSQGEDDPETSVSVPVRSDPGAEVPTGSAASPPHLKEFSSGLVSLAFPEEKVRASTIALALANDWPLHMCLGGGPALDEDLRDVGAPTYLFDDNPDGFVKTFSPLLVSLAETQRFFSLLDALWPRSPIALLVSRSDRRALLDSLRNLLGRREWPPQGALSYPFACAVTIPGAANHLLSGISRNFATELFRVLDAVIVPDPNHGHCPVAWLPQGNPVLADLAKAGPS